jgi:hypothetical protein
VKPFATNSPKRLPIWKPSVTTNTPLFLETFNT